MIFETEQQFEEALIENFVKPKGIFCKSLNEQIGSEYDKKCFAELQNLLRG